jgi:hypothetical protein
VYFYLARTVHELAFHDDELQQHKWNFLLPQDIKNVPEVSGFVGCEECHSVGSWQHSEGL